MNLWLRSISLFALVALAGCQPRGETVSLDEVLKTSQAEFSAVDLKEVKFDALNTLKAVDGKLHGVLSQSDEKEIAASSGEIADLLSVLVAKAGYPSRPGMGELISQYRSISTGNAKTDNRSAQVKLLVSRTYSLLASELQTAKFGV